MRRLSLLPLPVTAVLLPIWASVPAVADNAGGLPAAETIDEIVVVASKSARSLRDVAARVTIVDNESLAATLAVSGSDIFRYTPGVDSEESASRFGYEGVSIRGIGGNRVALLLDGIPLPDQFAVGSFSNATRDFLNAGLVERIEVLHGPASALYGSNAIGGVVATLTPNPATITGGRSSGGKLEYLRQDADGSDHGVGVLAMQGAQTGALLGGSYRDGAQMSAAGGSNLDTRKFRRRSLLAKLVHDTATFGSLHLSAIHQQAEVESSIESLLGSGRYRTTTALRGDDRNRLQILSAAWEFGNGDTQGGVVRVYHQDAMTEQKTLDDRTAATRPVAINRRFDFRQSIRGAELNVRRTFDLMGLESQLTGGLEYRERDSEELRDGLETGIDDGVVSNVILGEVFPLRDFPHSNTRERGAFLENSVRAGDWTLIAGLRADWYRLRPLHDPVFAEDYPFAATVPVSEKDLTPKLGLTYRYNDNLDAYLQYAQGFRAPPYEDANIGLELPVFNIRAVPNPDLASEHSAGFEAGMRWQSERLRLYAAWFRTDYDNFIESRVRIGTDPDSGRILFQARNLNSARIDGFEAGWDWSLPGRFEDFGFGGSLYRARGHNGESGQPLNSVGPGQLVLAVRWQPAGGENAVRLQATATEGWDHRDETAGALFKPPGHVVLDLYGSRVVGEHIVVRASIRNLTDRTWWYWSSVRGLSSDDLLLPQLAQPGRNFGISVQYRW
jgi:hemoglobin/transferrin/lactoferrin receptor protein